MKENLLENSHENFDWKFFFQQMTEYLEETRIGDGAHKQKHSTLFELISSIRPDYKEKAYGAAMKFWYLTKQLTPDEMQVFSKRLETDEALRKEIEKIQNSNDFDDPENLTENEIGALGEWMDKNPEDVEKIKKERELRDEIGSAGPLHDYFGQIIKNEQESSMFLESKTTMEIIELIFTDALTHNQAQKFVYNFLTETNWDEHSKSFADYYKYQFGVDLPPMTGKEIMKFIYKYMFDTYGVF